MGWWCKDACPPPTSTRMHIHLNSFFPRRVNNQQFIICSKDSVIICNRSVLLDVTLYIYLRTGLLRFWRVCWLHIDITVQYYSRCHKT